MPSSLWQRLVSWLTGTYAEFYDSKLVAQSDNREVTRVESTGVVKVKFSVLTNLEEGLFPQKNTPQDRHWQKNASVPP